MAWGSPIGGLDWAACKDCKHYDADAGCNEDETVWTSLLVVSLTSDEIRCGCWEKAA